MRIPAASESTRVPVSLPRMRMSSCRLTKVKNVCCLSVSQRCDWRLSIYQEWRNGCYLSVYQGLNVLLVSFSRMRMPAACQFTKDENSCCLSVQFPKDESSCFLCFSKDENAYCLPSYPEKEWQLSVRLGSEWCLQIVSRMRTATACHFTNAC